MRWLLGVLGFVAVVVYATLVFNPGYFSHDELQWASWSVGKPWAQVPWASIWDWQPFQYRPLTFNLWMLLSRWLFANPYLMHAACVALGLINALLLCSWLRQMDVSRAGAAAASLIWLLNPYAIYTHAWVAALADTLWLMLGLLALVIVTQLSHRSEQRKPTILAVMIAALCTALALLCKEAALCLPTAFFLAWLGQQRRPIWFWSGLASAAVVAMYLLLRLDSILQGAASVEAYALGHPQPMQRWAEYLIFPALLQRGHPFALLQEALSLRLGLSVALICIVTFAFFWRHPRWGMLWLGAPLAALLPVLLLPISHSHYAYSAAAVAAVILAKAWSSLARFGQVAAILWLALISLHGLQLAGKMHRDGRIQARLLADIHQFRLRSPDSPMRIFSDREQFAPLLERSISHVPSYRSIAWGDRVQSVPVAPQANFRMCEDGHVQVIDEGCAD